LPRERLRQVWTFFSKIKLVMVLPWSDPRDIMQRRKHRRAFKGSCKKLLENVDSFNILTSVNIEISKYSL